MQYVLETKGLCKQYKNFQALADLNMYVPKGSIYGFVGKNGAGKTTLIRVITGLQYPTAGSYHLYGIADSEKKIRNSRRRMGAVVETPSIYLDMTAEDNLKQQYLILGQPDFDGIRELLKLVGLGDTGKKKVKDFSLGMRQRLGIAITLAGNPDFLVLDEPVNGLDPQGIIEIRELILKLNREQGITVLISSHILDELSRLATHYGFIDHGHMVKEISAEELEAACAKKIRVKVSDMTAFSKALEQRKVDYRIISDDEADIYSKITVSELVRAADSFNCQILTMKEQDDHVTESGEIEYDGELEPNPNYLPEGSRERAVYEFLLDFTPGGQVMQLSAIRLDRIGYMMLYDVAWFVVVTGAGILMFRRKSLK